MRYVFVPCSIKYIKKKNENAFAVSTFLLGDVYL